MAQIVRTEQTDIGRGCAPAGYIAALAHPWKRGPCRICEVAAATGDDGLCDGCRGALTLRRAQSGSHADRG